jgi:Flp pilus assembly protein CpaB
MRTRSSARRGPGPLLMLLLGFVTLAGGGGAVLGALYGLGYVDFGGKVAAARPIDRTGQIAFPALARPVKAYAAITRDDLLNPKTRDLNLLWLPETAIQPEMLRDLSLILGRVVSRDKQPGMILSEADFFPKGTRPGVVAGVPVGQRAVSIRGGAVAGLHLLRRGDRFDILGAVPVRTTDPAPALQRAALSGGVESPATVIGMEEQRSGVQLLVRAGQLVTDGAANGDITLAVRPEEVAPFTAAIASDRKMFCVVRSGRPDDNPDDVPPGPDLEGLLPFPASAQTLPRYTEIREEHLADRATGKLKLFYFSPESADPSWVADPKKILGRVLARDVGVGYLFREDDFLPAGTREGVAGGVPAGKLALAVPPGRISGLQLLKSGDRFDLLATMPVDLRRELPQLRVGLGQDSIEGRDRLLGSLQRRATVQVIAEDAALVSTDPQGQFTVAVAPTEVAPVSKAITLGIEIFCVARSGRPESGPLVRISPDRHPTADLSVIEQITGNRRALEVFSTPADDSFEVPEQNTPPATNSPATNSPVTNPPATNLPPPQP